MKQCEICGKKPVMSFAVSHAHNRTKRRLMPNLQKVRIIENGTVKSVNVCTDCIRSNRIVKAPRGQNRPAGAAAE